MPLELFKQQAPKTSISPPQLFKRQAFKTRISCEASSTFQATSFQNEHFVRGLLNFSSNKLPKRGFRARYLNFSCNKLAKRAFRLRLHQLFKRQASKKSISCEASSTLQATNFQNEPFLRGLFNFSSNKLSKRAFRARPPQLFNQQGFKMSISCEASSTFQSTSFQNKHFVRGILFSSNELPKRAFCARPLQLFKQQASKTSISCPASSTFQATSFQNEHFVRSLLNFSINKLPKQAFRARPPQLFKQQASKTSISCEAPLTFEATSFQNERFVRGLFNFSSNKLPKRAFRATSSTFHAKSFQNKHFVRNLFNFSSNKLPKRAFRARPPQLFKQQTSKTSILREASSTFPATSLQNERFVRGFINFSSDKLPKRAFRARPPQLFKQEASKILRLPRKTQ